MVSCRVQLRRGTRPRSCGRAHGERPWTIPIGEARNDPVAGRGQSVAARGDRLPDHARAQRLGPRVAGAEGGRFARRPRLRHGLKTPNPRRRAGVRFRRSREETSERAGTYGRPVKRPVQRAVIATACAGSNVRRRSAVLAAATVPRPTRSARSRHGGGHACRRASRAQPAPRRRCSRHVCATGCRRGQVTHGINSGDSWRGRGAECRCIGIDPEARGVIAGACVIEGV